MAAALASDHPLALLSLASTLLSALDPRNDDPFDRSPDPDRPPLGEVLDSLVASGQPEAGALAWTIAHLATDDLVRARTVRALSTNQSAWPGWLREPLRLEFVGAQQAGDVLRDSTDVIVQARLAGHDLMAVALVDFNLGTIVKDCFFSDQTLDDFDRVWRQQSQAGLIPLETLALKDARARLEDAVETGARTWPPAETENWPASRPLLEWLLRQLPAGGTGFDRPEWSEEMRDRLAERFMASPYARDLDRPDDRSIVGDLLWYRTGYGYGDPLRWSVTALEILLLDWYPRKIVADQDYLLRMPAVLGRLIRFAHAEAGIDEALTEETLAGLEEFTPEYEEAVGRPRRQGPEALLERMGVLDPLPEADGQDGDGRSR